MEACRLFAGRRLVLVLIFILPKISSADVVNAEWYSTAAALSMGNAAIANAQDPSTAMFYNPAFLAQIRKPNFEFFNPQIEFGMDNLTVAKDLNNVGKLADLSKTRELQVDNQNKSTFLGASFYPNFYAKNFAMGVLVKAQGGSYVDTLERLHYNSQYLLVPTVAFSIGLWKSFFQIGVAARWVQIAEHNKTDVTDFTNIGYAVNTDEGFGFGVDVGMKWTIPWAALPTIGLVARNIGDTKLDGKPIVNFLTSGEKAVPANRVMTYDLGFSIAPKLSRRLVWSFSFDYRDVRDDTRTTSGRKINAGTELKFGKSFMLRGGWSRGYWTGGIGIAGRRKSLDIGTYAEESDPKKYLVRSDRRLVIKFGNKF